MNTWRIRIHTGSPREFSGGVSQSRQPSVSIASRTPVKFSSERHRIRESIPRGVARAIGTREHRVAHALCDIVAEQTEDPAQRIAALGQGGAQEKRGTGHAGSLPALARIPQRAGLLYGGGRHRR